MRIIRILLFPISFIYGQIVRLRNWLFDIQFFKSTSSVVPTVILGNLHVGGTGKTPHTLLIAKKLESKFKLAILSRGYGRKTKGFRYVTMNESSAAVGDETLLFAMHTNAVVAVDEDRVHGVEKLRQERQPDMILLDDAFQHRKIAAQCYVLLVPFHSPIHKAYYLPSGSLRDHKSQIQRADIIVVTGTPRKLSDEEKCQFILSEKYPENIPVHFSHVKFGQAKRNYSEAEESTIPPDSQVIAITGIAKPSRFTDYLKGKYNLVHHFEYRDHHDFTRSDIKQWKKMKIKFPNANWLTTEKDFVRMLSMTDEIAEFPISFIPIQVTIEGSDDFLKFIENKAMQPNNSKNLSNS